MAGVLYALKNNSLYYKLFESPFVMPTLEMRKMKHEEMK